MTIPNLQRCSATRSRPVRLLIALALTACKATTMGTTTSVTGSLAVSAGDGQSAVVGTSVPTAPSVVARDQSNKAVAGVPVTFAVASGGGSITAASQTTDANGVAQVGSWTLGTSAGANTLTATPTMNGSAGPPVTFTATGLAGPASALAINDGNNQSAVPGASVGTAPSVIVRDQFNNPVHGTGVTYSVTGGGGSITGASPTTGTNGVARVGSWTLGSTAGTNTLLATTAGLPGSPVTFTATGTTPGSVTMYYNSSEAGCDGSDANVLFCDDFESGFWYTADCDHGGWTAQQKGWCGTIYANPITPVGAVVCGSRGVNHTNCAADGGLHDGTASGVNMAMHAFAGGPVNELWARWYYKTDAGYLWGAEKHTNFTKQAGDITWFNIQLNCGVGSTLTTAVPYIQIIHGPSSNCWAPSDSTFSLQSGRWYYFEVHVRLNSSGTVADGLIDMWINDCGTDGVCSGTPTLRTHLTNVAFDRNQTGCTTTPCQIEALWFENWANPGSSGTGYLDQIKAAKVGPIGFMP